MFLKDQPITWEHAHHFKGLTMTWLPNQITMEENSDVEN